MSSPIFFSGLFSSRFSIKESSSPSLLSPPSSRIAYGVRCLLPLWLPRVRHPIDRASLLRGNHHFGRSDWVAIPHAIWHMARIRQPCLTPSLSQFREWNPRTSPTLFGGVGTSKLGYLVSRSFYRPGKICVIAADVFLRRRFPSGVCRFLAIAFYSVVG